MDKEIEMLRQDVERLEAMGKELARLADEFRKPIITKEVCDECNTESD